MKNDNLPEVVRRPFQDNKKSMPMENDNDNLDHPGDYMDQDEDD